VYEPRLDMPVIEGPSAAFLRPKAITISGGSRPSSGKDHDTIVNLASMI